MAQSRVKKEEAKGCLPESLSHQCGDCTFYCCLCPPKSRVSFGIWANVQAFVASVALFGTAILASSFDQTANTSLYQAGRYIKYLNIPIALFIMFCEYPLGSKRGGGAVYERPFQSYIAPIHYFFRFFTRNYFFRSILYFLFVAPSCPQLHPPSLSSSPSSWNRDPRRAWGVPNTHRRQQPRSRRSKQRRA